MRPMSENDELRVSDKTRQVLREEFADHDQPTDEEIQAWVDEAGAPDLDDAEVEADGRGVYDSTDE